MFDNTVNTEVTDISQVKFEIQPPNSNASENVTIPTTDVSKNEAEKVNEGASGEKKPEVANTEINKDAVKENPDASKKEENPTVDKNTPAPTEKEPIQLTEEDEDNLLNEISGGRVSSFDDLDKKLSRLEELEKNPSLLFSDPNKAKIFEFLSKYQGSDYSQGIQTFARLQQMNLESMDSDSALKELYLLENVKMGLTKEKAELLWEHEKADKYDSKGDIGAIIKDRDAIMAKQKLAEMKQETTVPKVDTQQDQAAAQAKQEREAYISQVENSFKNEQGQFKGIEISFSDNPEEDFSFEVPNTEEVYNAAKNYNQFWEERYINKNGTYNAQQLQIDISTLKNLPALLDKVFEHAVSIGVERNMRERTNTPASNTPASNAPASGSGKTIEQSIKELNPHLFKH